MKRYYNLEGVEYAVSLCTAKARPGIALEREMALHISRTVGNEISECIMYDAEMPVDDLTMTALIKFPGEICTDPDILATVAEEQEEVEVEQAELSPDFLLGKINDITEQHREELAKAEADLAMEKDARRLDALRYEEEMNRERFLNGQFWTVVLIAIVILLWNFKAVALWLAVLVCLALLVRMVYATKVYYGKRKEKKRG